jgi:hypothetical protein
MTMLSKVRHLAFMVLLIVALTPGGALRATDGQCTSYGPCEWCDTPVGKCYLWEGGQCEQYPECVTVGWCTWDEGRVDICECGPCRPD